MLILLATALASGAPAGSPPLEAQALPEATLQGVMSRVGPGYRVLTSFVTEPLTQAFRGGDWPEAARLLQAIDPQTLNTREQTEHAFLHAWALIRADRAADAVHYLARIEDATTVPAAYRDLVRGELLLERGDAVQALDALRAVPELAAIYPRAAVLRAETLRELNRLRESGEVFEQIVQRPDPSPGNPLALLALGMSHGAGSPQAYPYLRRLWARYPTSPQASKAAELLGRYPATAEYRPTAEEWSYRAEGWMYGGDYGNAILAADQSLQANTGRDEATCRAMYTKGRSLYKKNQLANAIAAFGDAGERCAGVAMEYGAKALYLQGTAQFRKKQYRSSAATFLKIPTLHREHSMADDGFTHAGISLYEEGDLDGARGMWLRALDELPDGDTAAEATWRLAWSYYLDGDPAQARAVALRLSQLSPAVDAVHSDAGRYWHARWALYPDVKAPTKADPRGRDEAIEGWTRLLRERPFSFYSVLAAGRLAEVAPDQLEALQRRDELGPLERPWEVRTAFLEHPGVRDGVALARLGLVREAMLEWERFEPDLLPDEAAWLFELRAIAGDWLLGHAAFRSWIGSHPVGSLGEGERAVVHVAYPDRYWDEVQRAATYDTYEPRLFHALVREESNFNKRIVSFAGARGLSQLMPATAQQTAGWMGRKVTQAELFEPQTNLDIGARYLHQVHKELSGSPYCALAGYNAGPGRVRQWRGEWGNVPTDEFVERIPFRETRGYVKRVMGTWQTYRWYKDDGAPFVDLSRYNHQVLP